MCQRLAATKPLPFTGIVDARDFRIIRDSIPLLSALDSTGAAIEDFGSFGGWQNNIGAFIPGKGYRMKVNTSDTLIIENAYVKLGIVPSR